MTETSEHNNLPLQITTDFFFWCFGVTAGVGVTGSLQQWRGDPASKDPAGTPCPGPDVPTLGSLCSPSLACRRGILFWSLFAFFSPLILNVFSFSRCFCLTLSLLRWLPVRSCFLLSLSPSSFLLFLPLRCQESICDPLCWCHASTAKDNCRCGLGGSLKITRTTKCFPCNTEEIIQKKKNQAKKWLPVLRRKHFEMNWKKYPRKS